RTVVAPVLGMLRAGRYTVTWRMAGADGHPTHGHFAFSILPGARGLAAPPAPAATLAPPPDSAHPGEAAGGVPAPGRDSVRAVHLGPAADDTTFGAESPAYVALRWAQFLALLAVIGAAAFALLVLGPLERSGRSVLPALSSARGGAARLGFAAAVVLVPVALLRLYAQSYAVHGAAGALSGARIGGMLAGTTWGWGWLLQAGATLLALAGFGAARRVRGAGWTVAALAVGLLALTPALSGHAAAAPRFAGLAVTADAAHVLGAGGWLGSLLLLVAVGIPAALRLEAGERGRAVAELVGAFSPAALACAGTAAITGVLASWLHLERFADLWQTGYGRTLLLKLAVLAVAAGIGAYHWLRVRPALGDEAAAGRMRRSSVVELVVGAAALLVTAVLVATSPPG
ncbi:MAG: CopD family protein, partial [Gemmatimonadetes bacterium]|nr:CopD family protein [Gemmatimonadota bacterium]